MDSCHEGCVSLQKLFFCVSSLHWHVDVAESSFTTACCCPCRSEDQQCCISCVWLGAAANTHITTFFISYSSIFLYLSSPSQSIAYKKLVSLYEFQSNVMLFSVNMGDSSTKAASLEERNVNKTNITLVEMQGEMTLWQLSLETSWWKRTCKWGRFSFLISYRNALSDP